MKNGQQFLLSKSWVVSICLWKVMQMGVDSCYCQSNDCRGNGREKKWERSVTHEMKGAQKATSWHKRNQPHIKTLQIKYQTYNYKFSLYCWIDIYFIALLCTSAGKGHQVVPNFGWWMRILFSKQNMPLILLTKEDKVWNLWFNNAVGKDPPKVYHCIGL